MVTISKNLKKEFNGEILLAQDLMELKL